MNHVRGRASIITATITTVVLVGCGTVPAPHPIVSTTLVCRTQDGRADTTCTPGAIDPRITQQNLATTICRPGWNTSNGPRSYSLPLLGGERHQFDLYGLTTVNPGDYEQDELIPSPLGGDPTDIRNVWPQPRHGPRPAGMKNSHEHQLRVAVCTGKLSLRAAQTELLRSWTHPSVSVGGAADPGSRTTPPLPPQSALAVTRDGE